LGEFTVSRRASEDADLASFLTGKLEDEMGGSSEAVKTEPQAAMRAAQAIRTVADDSGAEKRSGIFVGKSWRERVRVGLADQHGFGVTAVGVVSGELG